MARNDGAYMAAYQTRRATRHATPSSYRISGLASYGTARATGSAV